MKINSKTEENFEQIKKQEKIKNKQIITSMYVLLVTISLFYIGIIFISVSALKEGILLYTIITSATIILVIVALYSLKLEINAGYYECKRCHNRYVPKNYFTAMFAPHINTTRYMKCPKCSKRSWSKKVMTK